MELFCINPRDGQASWTHQGIENAAVLERRHDPDVIFSILYHRLGGCCWRGCKSFRSFSFSKFLLLVVFRFLSLIDVLLIYTSGVLFQWLANFVALLEMSCGINSRPSSRVTTYWTTSTSAKSSKDGKIRLTMRTS